MKKTTKLKSCLTSMLSIVVIAIAIGYELKIDWVVDLISARSLIVGAIAAAFFNAYGSFEFGDEKKETVLHEARNGMENAEFTKSIIGLIGAIKAYVSSGSLSAILEWVISILLGFIILFAVMGTAWLLQMIVYGIQNWKKLYG